MLFRSDGQTTLATATAGDVLRTNVDSTTTYVLPLTSTSVSLTVTLKSSSTAAVTAGEVVKVTPTWSGTYVSSDVTPATSTTGTNYTANASGKFTLSLTNATPSDGAQVSLAITGFASGAGTVGTGSRTVNIVWQKPVVTSVSVLDPVDDNAYIKIGATTTFTVGVYDQFGNGMAGEKLQPGISDSGAANYVKNKTYSTITTGAAGTATFSLTDAGAAAKDDYDTVVFTSATDTTKSASRTISYNTALPVVSTINMYYSDTYAGSATTLVPTTAKIGRAHV